MKLKLPETMEELSNYRQQVSKGKMLFGRFSMDGLKLTELNITTRGNHLLAATHYIPENISTPLPTVIFFHGGGFVFPGNGSHLLICADIAKRTPAVVLCVSYRLAPETPFPGAVEDSYDTLKWVHQHIKELGGSVDRITVAGDSAGGNLAAVTCLIARENGPSIASQILFYPPVDFTRVTPSKLEFAKGYVPDRELSQWFLKQYVPDVAARIFPHASPLLATDHSNLPKALIHVAEYDTLRDEGILYGEALKKGGVDVEVTLHKGAGHGFMSMALLFSYQYEHAMSQVIEFLNRGK